MFGITRGPVLVTGSHRSGSTWVGRMIASHARVGYVDEPFNPELHPGCPVGTMWHHVTEEDAPRFRAYLRRVLRFSHDWWQDFRSRPGARRFAGATLRALQALRHRYFSRPLMKDPIAFFSAEWLAEEFGMDVVLLSRHPLAFAASLKRLGWHCGFHLLLAQPRLLHGLLQPFADEIRYWNARRDIIGHAILFWRIIHHVMLDYRRRHPFWVFVRHEDLSLRPAAEFEKLFRRLGLEFTAGVRRTIARHCAANNPTFAPNNVPHHLQRNSRANVCTWQSILSPEEVRRILRGTADVARFLYPDGEELFAGGDPAGRNSTAA
jgi:Sulfotransferase family